MFAFKIVHFMLDEQTQRDIKIKKGLKMFTFKIVHNILGDLLEKQ